MAMADRDERHAWELLGDEPVDRLFQQFVERGSRFVEEKPVGPWEECLGPSRRVYGDARGFHDGFLYSGGTSGTYTTIDDPLGVDGTIATGINASGQIVGDYLVLREDFQSY
jgi:hypothetical protein